MSVLNFSFLTQKKVIAIHGSWMARTELTCSLMRRTLSIFLAISIIDLFKCEISIAPSDLRVSFVTRTAISLIWSADPRAEYYMIMMKPVDSTSDFQSYGPNAKIPFPQADIGGLTTGEDLFRFRKENIEGVFNDAD